MRDLNFDLKTLCLRNPHGSRATQAERFNALQRFANDLYELGFRHMRASSLKEKHVEALVAKWRDRDKLSIGSIKNNMAHLRWWAQLVDKRSVVAKDNSHYGIGQRTFVTNVSKAKTPEDIMNMSKIQDPYVAFSVRFQVAFGLRKEEAIKIRPSVADRGDKLALKDTWTKGGRAREIPIRTHEQRQLLEEARRFAGDGSLIPADRSYIEQERRFDYQTQKAGLYGNHGWRHAYAQNRYEDLTGRKPPAAGGLTSRHLTKAQRAEDRQARQIITAELGHGRTQVTTHYLGR